MGEQQVRTRDIAKVVIASTVGSSMEWYDLFVFGFFANLVFPKVFFASPTQYALATSIAAYGVTYLARPVAALVFGNYGDKLGRKAALIWTLVAMGAGTVGIGLLPPFATIGVLAPILLIVFRFVQGFGIGGEWGGAATWTLEFAARTRWRSFWSGWTNVSTAIAQVGASFALSLVIVLPQNDMLAWGWRIPFLAGFLVLIVGIIIRLRLLESPVFLALKQQGSIDRAPAITTLRKYWRLIILLALSFIYVTAAGGVLNVPFVISYMNALKISPGLISSALLIGSIAGVFASIIGAVSGDVIGRKWTDLLGSVLTAVVAFPFFLLIGTTDASAVIFAEILLVFVFQFGNGAIPSLFTEHFPGQYRYTGAGFSNQLGAFLAGLGVSFVVPVLIISQGGPLGAWPYVAGFGAAYAVISSIAILLLKETKQAAVT